MSDDKMLKLQGEFKNEKNKEISELEKKIVEQIVVSCSNEERIEKLELEQEELKKYYSESISLGLDNKKELSELDRKSVV